MSTEVELVTAKAAKLSPDELRAELIRISAGMGCAQSKGALKRYNTRYVIYSHELTRKNLEGGAR